MTSKFLTALVAAALVGCMADLDAGRPDDPGGDTGGGGNDVGGTGGGGTDTGGGVDTGGGMDTGGGTDVDPGPNPTGTSVSVTLEPFDVQPGTERQVCKTVNVPAEAALDVVQFHSTMVANSHHLIVYKVLTGDKTAPVTGAEGTVQDCSPARDQFSGDAAYLYGAATPERTMGTPAGVSFHLEPGQRLILEQHVINYTESVVQGGATLDLVTAAPGATIAHHADIVWMGNWGFFLLPGQSSTSTQHCAMPYNMQVFGLSSHTHALGTRFTIDKWGGAGGRLYESTDWQHPIYLELDPPVAVAAGEGLEWACSWTNTSGGIVTPGENSTDEMCIAFAAAYPTDTLDAAPVQCNVPFTP